MLTEQNLRDQISRSAPCYRIGFICENGDSIDLSKIKTTIKKIERFIYTIERSLFEGVSGILQTGTSYKFRLEDLNHKRLNRSFYEYLSEKGSVGLSIPLGPFQAVQDRTQSNLPHGLEFQIDINLNLAISIDNESKYFHLPRYSNKKESARIKWKLWVRIFSKKLTQKFDLDSLGFDEMRELQALLVHELGVVKFFNQLFSKLSLHQKEISEQDISKILISVAHCEKRTRFSRIYSAFSESLDIKNADLEPLERLQLDDIKNEISKQCKKISPEYVDSPCRFFWCNLEEGYSALMAQTMLGEKKFLIISGLSFSRKTNPLFLSDDGPIVSPHRAARLISRSIMNDINRWI